ncbi:MAG TPA: twin-arginine translocation signal domain-containing protein [Candidatus Dormibacteraeota bacterium]|nr:twin-arginine translocation signal domain-containing protein [Candidatus Dormibacteraeota bacterium]
MSVEERLAADLKRALEPVQPRPGGWAQLRSQLEESPPVPLWHRVWERGISRRQFLGGVAATAAAALLPAPPIAEAPKPPEPPPPLDVLRPWNAPRGQDRRWVVHHPARGGGKPGNLPVYAPPTPDEHDLYLPGIGFRRPRGMASRGPVSAVAGGLTLTVHRVAVLGRGTWLEFEVSGVVPGPGSRGIGFDVSLRADGQVHPAGHFRNHRDDDRITVRTVARLGPLRPDLAEVEVIVGGEQIGGDLHALVPLVPAVEAGLMATRLTGAAATLGGVTVSVPRAVLGTDPTVLLLEVRTPPPHSHVWIGSRIAIRGRGDELTLLDADGREYLEEPTVLGFSHDPAVIGDVAFFPRLPPDATGLRLVVPTVTVAAFEGEAELRVPLAGVRPGGAVPLGLDVAFGGDPLRVVAAELWELATGRLLTLRLDLGPRRQGRLLLGPGQVLVDGEDRGFRGRWSGPGHARYETIDVPLPPETPDEVSITLRLPRVEILGPWIVPLGF